MHRLCVLLQLDNYTTDKQLTLVVKSTKQTAQKRLTAFEGKLSMELAEKI
jgi:hypothetical protein